MNCKKCGIILLRSEGGKLNEEGLCETCVKTGAEAQKQTNDLLTAFGGKGKRGFVQWLKMGKFLYNIEDEKDTVRYNDRVDIIRQMIGEAKYEKMLDKFADIVLELAVENPNES